MCMLLKEPLFACRPPTLGEWNAPAVGRKCAGCRCGTDSCACFEGETAPSGVPYARPHEQRKPSSGSAPSASPPNRGTCRSACPSACRGPTCVPACLPKSHCRCVDESSAGAPTVAVTVNAQPSAATVPHARHVTPESVQMPAAAMRMEGVIPEEQTGEELSSDGEEDDDHGDPDCWGGHFDEHEISVSGKGGGRAAAAAATASRARRRETDEAGNTLVGGPHSTKSPSRASSSLKFRSSLQNSGNVRCSNGASRITPPSVSGFEHADDLLHSTASESARRGL